MASPATLAAGALLVLTGLLVLAAAPLRPRALPLFALLALWGAATLANAVYTGASDPELARTFARLTLWYSLPLPLLMLLVLPSVAGAPPGPTLRSATWALAGLTAASLAAYAWRPGTFVAGVRPFAEGHTVESGPLLYGYFVSLVAVQAAVVLAASRLARRPDAAPMDVHRGRWLAGAFGILVLHAAGFFLAFSLLGAPDASAPYWARALPTLAAGAVALAALARLGTAPRVALFLALILGAIDGLAGAQILRSAFIPGYERNAVALRVLFAAALAVAVLRYGLGDAGDARRRHVGRVATAALAVVSFLAVAALGFLALGRNPVAAGAGVVLGGALPIALRARFAEAGRAIAERLLLAPDDPRAVAERARAYAAAVAAAQGAGAEGARYLARLREDLGISAREHELLVQGIASRESPSYRTTATLASGATSQVDLAIDARDGRLVVLKRYHALRDPAGALREARVLASVRHPRVVPLLEVDRRGDDLHLVLAHAPGGSARQLIDREGPLPPARAVALARDLLEGLEALHAAGVVHCDVKLENLLLDGDGRGLLGDFGSARVATDEGMDATLPGGAGEGSLSTLSPEALRRAPPAPARDIYAAGAVLYRLLTGQHHVGLEGASAFEARERILLDPPRLPHPRVPGELEPVLRKALAKAPEERYQSAAQMLAALG